MRRAYLLALIPAVVLGARIAKAEVVNVSATDGSEWTMTIAPAPANSPASAMQLALSEATTLVAHQDVDAPQTPAEAPTVPAESVVTAQPYDDGMAIEPDAVAVPTAAEFQRIYNALPFSRAEYLANPSYRYDTTMELLTGKQRQVVVHRNYTPKLHGPSEGHPLFLYNRYGGGTGIAGPYGYGGGGGFGWGFRYTPQYAPAFRYFLPIEDLY